MFYVCGMVISCQTVAAKDRVVGNKYVTISTSHARICKLEPIGNNFYAYYLPEDGTIPTGETIAFSVSPTADYTLTSDPNPSIAVNNSAAWSVSPIATEKKGANGEIFVTRVTMSITVDGDKATDRSEDGEDSLTFSCNVYPKTLNPNYEWLASEVEGSWPPNAGNSPCLRYESPFSQETITLSNRWYALPNSPLMKNTPFEAPYSVNCKVTIDDVVSKTKYKDNLIVYLRDPLGEVSGSSLTGSKDVSTSTRVVNGVSEWYVKDIGGFRRTSPIQKIWVLKTSCFIEKVTAHEQSHVKQYTEKTPWKNLYLAQEYYSAHLQSLVSNIGPEDLKGTIKRRIDQLWEMDYKVDQANILQSEKDAYTVSNAEGPKFLNVEMDDVQNHTSLSTGTIDSE